MPGPPKWEVRESLGKRVLRGAHAPHRGRGAGGVREDQSHMMVARSETQLRNLPLGENHLIGSFELPGILSSLSISFLPLDPRV